MPTFTGEECPSCHLRHIVYTPPPKTPEEERFRKSRPVRLIFAAGMLFVSVIWLIVFLQSQGMGPSDILMVFTAAVTPLFGIGGILIAILFVLQKNGQGRDAKAYRRCEDCGLIFKP